MAEWDYKSVGIGTSEFTLRRWRSTDRQSFSTYPQSLRTGPRWLGDAPRSLRGGPRWLRVRSQRLRSGERSLRGGPQPRRATEQLLSTGEQGLRPGQLMAATREEYPSGGEDLGATQLVSTPTPPSGRPAALNGLQETRISRTTGGFSFNVLHVRKEIKVMPNTDYLPKADNDLLVWFNSFQLKFATYGPTLGFTAADVTGISDDYKMLAYIVQAAELIRNESQARTSYKNVVRDGPLGTVQPTPPSVPTLTPPATIVAPGIIPRLRALVQRLKTHPGYTESIGTDLGIIATATAKPTTPAKPTATASAEPGSAARIDWVKGGFDGVLVESQRGDETVWTSLGTDLQSPYNDTRAPLHPGAPEVRRYRLRYLKSDEPTGDYSDTMTVTTTP